jgi:uncharacterized protein (DUF1499 family)
MIAATAAGTAARTGFSRGIALLGPALAIGSLLLLTAGPIGWRVGWWSYQIAFTTLMPCAFYGGLAAMVVSALGLIVGFGGIARREFVGAGVGLILGGVAAYFPWHASEARGVFPPMHDITTDTVDPPSFDFATQMRAAEHGAPIAYPGQSTTAMQQKFYPGIAPAMLDVPPAQAFDRVLAVVKTRGWTIVKSDPAAGIIDADDRSFWFGFTDDIAIRVTSVASGSRVDIRSGSRQGRGDFGINAARVRGFLAALTGKP